jgi:uncharacterized protein (DUF885 family)
MFRTINVFVLNFLILSASWATTASDTLQDLQTEYWEFRLHESPLLATATGDARYNDQLGAVSLVDSKRRNNAIEKFFDRLNSIAAKDLAATDRINYEILKRALFDSLAEFHFGNYLMPITQRDGFYLEFPQLHHDIPLVTLKDYENYLARLNAYGKYTDGYIELMRTGIAENRVLPAVVLVGWEKGVAAQIVEDPTRSEIYAPFIEFPSTVPATEYARLREQAAKAISTVVVPAYSRFRKFMADEYVPHARDTIGASALPDGRDFYRHRVRMFTTTDLTPEEVHQLGLAEVKRIRGEMEQVIAEVGFKGTFAEFLTYLREDPRFYAKSSDELLKEVALILKKIDGELPGMFGKLPRTSYGIREIPAYVAPRTTAAYYQPPNGDGTKAGFYYVNTYNLKSRPFYNLEALSLHEAVPGHHLQIALQQELEDVPQFRRFSDFTAFVEGWALYAERLGLEAGFYRDPYSNFGRLTMEMWRACRLVVDTGMHYLGWTREQAIKFLADNTALSMHDIESEVDRYIAWPGQALAYKVGELKIRELRGQVEEKLGTSFDIREFHDVVLGSGALPLDLLEANVQAWLATKTADH